jgi:hypothetical protein
MAEAEIRALEFELERAEHGMGMPYDAERVQQLRRMLADARRRKLSEALARRRAKPVRGEEPKR